MERERNIKKTCQRCGKIFYAATNNAKRCENCREIWNKEQNNLRHRKIYAAKKKKTFKNAHKSLNQILKDLKRYNEENGTHLSYGQYVKIINL